MINWKYCIEFSVLNEARIKQMHIFCVTLQYKKKQVCLYTRIIVEISDAYMIYFEGWQAGWRIKSMNICMQQISTCKKKINAYTEQEIKLSG